MHQPFIKSLCFSFLLFLVPFVAQAQTTLLSYATPGDINDMSSSSPLWPLAGLVVVGLGFIIVFQYKHRKNLK